MVTLLAVALAGCLDVHRPVVPSSIVTASDNGWQVTNGDTIEDGDFAPKTIETQYLHDPDDEGTNTFPGVLVLVGLRTIVTIDPNDLLGVARDILEDEMEGQGVEADSISEETGSRTIQSGATTRWLAMEGTARSDAILFSQAQEIRMLAEAWYDEESNMHVIAIAIVQTGGTDFVGQVRTDLSVWNEVVGDTGRSIEGAFHQQGFIDHVVIED